MLQARSKTGEEGKKERMTSNTCYNFLPKNKGNATKQHKDQDFSPVTRAANRTKKEPVLPPAAPC